MSEERKIEYVQVQTPDIMRLSEYVVKAKGINRTMAQFAEDCGIGASTLSRIANGKIKKPLTEEMIRAIYEHRAPESDINLDSFIRVNGMWDKKEYERRTSMGQSFAQREQGMNRERQVKNAILSALINRDVPILKIPKSLERRRTDAPYGMRMYFDFAFYIEDAPQQLWYFDVTAYKSEENIHNSAFFLDRLNSKLAKIFLVDSWQPDYFANQKTTFVFCDSLIYNSVVAQFQGAPINSAITVMLVDTDNELIVEEKWLSSAKKTPSVLDRPVGDSDGYVATWVDDDFEDPNNI